MNRNLYRIVFNKTRGLMMVVAEKVAAQRKGDRAAGSTSRVHSDVRRKDAPNLKLKTLQVFVGWALGVVVVIPAGADIVADRSAPKNQQPTVLNAANGVPLVNIQTPSAAGVSRNTYSQFDVSQQGAILNNSRTNVQTQLGGYVQGNPWLATGSARILLNEVNSNNPSLLHGYIEVAGIRAQVVVANPSGISCDGCGFINANRATLTTGTPIFSGGDLEGYRVQRGIVTVAGAGMDASQTDYTDIIARAVQVNAGIWANTLKVSTGVNEVSADHNRITPVGSGEGDAPALALDVAALGGMYAGKITLIGTEAGVGVRNAGAIGATAGQVSLDANGMVTNSGTINTTSADSDVVLRSKGFANSGSIGSQHNIAIRNDGDVTNSGFVISQRELLLETSGLLTNHQGVLSAQRLDVSAAGLANDGQGVIQQTGVQALQFTAQAITNHNGGLIGLVPVSTGSGSGGTAGGGTGGGAAGGATTPPSTAAGGSGSVMVVAPVILADGVINIRGEANNDGAQIVANGNMALTANNGLQNSAMLNLDKLTVSGNTFSNTQGEIKVSHAKINTNTLDNSHGNFAIGESLVLSTHDFLNRQGNLQQLGSADLAIHLAGDLDSTAGRIASNSQNLTLSASTLTNATGQIQHAGTGTLKISASTLAGSGGQMSSNGLLDLTATSATLDQGSTTAKQIQIDSATLSNKNGQIIQTGSDVTRIQATSQLDNTGGVLASNGHTTLTVGDLLNQGGAIRATGNASLTLNASGAVDNRATLPVTDGGIRSGGAATVTAASLDNRQDLISSGDTLSLVTSQDINNQQGRMAADHGLTLSAGAGINNTAAHLESAAGAVRLTAIGALTNVSGNLVAEQNVHLQAASLDNTQGQISGQDVGITTSGALDNAGNALILAKNDLTLATGRLDNQGDLRATRHLDVSATDTLSNSGTIYAQGNTSLTTAKDISNSGEIAARGHTTLTANGSNSLISSTASSILAAGLESDGTLNHSGNLTVTATHSLAALGRNLAGGDQSLSAKTLDLMGSDTSAQNLTLTASSGNLNATAATLVASGTLTASTPQTLLTNHASLSAAQLNLTAHDLSNVQGDLVQTGNGDTTIHLAGDLDNTAGRIASNSQNLTLSASTLTNATGQIQHAGTGTLKISAGTLAGQSGQMTSNGLLDLTATSATLDQGSTTAQQIQIDTTTLSNKSGQIVQTGSDVTRIQASSQLDNTGGVIASNGHTTLTVGDLLNQGGAIRATGKASLTLNASGAVDNRATLPVTEGGIRSGGAATVTAARLDNRQGLISSGDTLSLVTSQDINNQQGRMAADHGLTLSAGAGIDNTAAHLESAAGAVRLTAIGALTNVSGSLVAQQNVNLQAASLDNTQGQISGQNVGITTSGALDNAGSALILAKNDLTLATGRLDNQGDLRAIRHLDVNATDTLSNSGTIYAQGNTSLTSAKDISNSHLIAAQGNTTLTANGSNSLISSTASSILAAGLDTDGKLSHSGNLTVTATHSVAALGRNLAGGDQSLTAKTLDLTGSDTSAQNLTLTASSGNLDASTATLVASGTLAASTPQTLLTNHASLTAAQLNLTAHDLSNVQGDLVQTGNGDTTINLAGDLDNTTGRIATNSQNLTLSASTLTNATGQIQHAGTGTLQIGASTLAGSGGQMSSNGLLDLTATSATLDQGSTTAKQIQIDTTTLSNKSGQIVQTGSDVTRIQASSQLDNTGGVLASNGHTTLTVGDLLNQGGAIRATGKASLTLNASGAVDNHATLPVTEGGIRSGGVASVTAASLDNNQGLISSGDTLSLVTSQGINNSQGRMAADSGVTLTAGADINNTAAHIESAAGAVSLTASGALTNVRGHLVALKNVTLQSASLDNTHGQISGQNVGITTSGALDNAGSALILAKNDLTLATGRLDNQGDLRAIRHLDVNATDTLSNSGTIYAQGNTSLTSAKDISNSHLIAAQGNTTLTANGSNSLISSTASSILAAGLESDGTLNHSGNLTVTATHSLAALGRNLAGGDQSLSAKTLDLMGSDTSAQNLTLTASSGNLNATAATLVASGTLTASTPQTLTTNHASLSAAQLNLTAHDLSNVQGDLVQTGSADLAINLAGNLDNSTGRIASNSQNLTLSASTLTNAAGQIQHAGTGTLKISADTLAGSSGQMSSNGLLDLTATTATLDQGSTTAQQIQIDTTTLSNKSGQIVQTGSDVTRIQASSQLDNTGGVIASNGHTTLTVGDLLNQGGAIRATGKASLTLNASGAVDNRATLPVTEGGIRSGGAATVTAARLDNRQGLISSGDTLSLVTSQDINNQQGRMAADHGLTLSAGAGIDNTAAHLESAAGAVRLTAIGALTNVSGSLVAQQNVNLQAASLDNTQGQISGQNVGITTSGALDNAGSALILAKNDLTLATGRLDNQGDLRAIRHLDVNATDTLSNSGTIYAQGNTSLTSAKDISNSHLIAAQGNTTLTANGSNSLISSTASSILAAGLESDGTLNHSGNLTVTATHSLAALGRNLAGGDQSLSAKTLDLMGSDTSAQNLTLTASSGNLNATAATLVASGTLTASTPQTLTTNHASLSAAQLNLTAHDLSNVQGDLVQTGSADLAINLAGNLDNSTGRIASNSQNLTLSASTLTNAAGQIQHAGTGTLKISADTLAGSSGQMSSNGLLDLTATTATLDQGSTTAKQIQIDSATLSNKNGQIIQTGSDVTRIQATSQLDNTGGVLASNGNTTLTVGDLLNQGGAIRATGKASLTLNASGAVDNHATLPVTEGGIRSGGAATVTAASLDNRQGLISSGDTLSLATSQDINNSQGLLASSQALSATASTIDNSSGTIASVHAGLGLNAVSGAINNTLGKITAAQALSTTSQGMDNTDGLLLANSASINTREQLLNNTRGMMITAAGLDLQSGALTNNSGLIQSSGNMLVNTHGQTLTNSGSGNSKGLLSQGTMTLTTGDLDNATGYIGARGAIDTHSAAVINSAGGIITSESSIALNGSRLDNQAGQVQALSNVLVNAGTGSIDNRAGLLRSGDTLTVKAAGIDNRNTQGSDQGIEGDSVAITASSLDNRSGAIRANQALGITGNGQVNNTQGLISSSHTLDIDDPQAISNPTEKTQTIVNTNGILIAGTRLAIDSKSLTGDGKVLSQGDLTVKLIDGYTHTGEFVANGNATLQTSGNLTNQAKLLAGNSLTLTATNINNTASREISGRNTNVTANNKLTNRGLINGGDTFINAAILDNLGTGRIYGDHVAIAANTLTNDTETVSGLRADAVIAARQRLDIGATTISNREHALLFSLGDIGIGGRLDGNHQSAGQGDTLNNNSATIEALGNLSVRVGQINNTNEHFAYQNQLTSTRPDVREDISSSQYRIFTETIYEPVITQTDPGKIIAGHDISLSATNVVNSNSKIVSGAALTVSGTPILNVGPEGQKRINHDGTTFTYGKTGNTHGCGKVPRRQCDDYDWMASDYNTDIVSTVTISEGVAQSNTHFSGTGTQIPASNTASVDQTATGAGSASAPLQNTVSQSSGTHVGAVNATAASTLNPVAGSTSNAQSDALAATSSAAVSPAAVVNIAAGSALNPVTGSTANAQSDAPAATSSAAASSAAAVNATAGSALNPVTGSTANAQSDALATTSSAAASSAAAVNATAGSALNPVTGSTANAQSDALAATSSSAAGRTAAVTANNQGGIAPVVRTVSLNITLPSSSLFRTNPKADARYLIETDPSFTNYSTWLSSDYLLGQITADPAYTQKRLGDGFYEQRLINEQVAQLTGRRFLEGYAADEAQYQALMNNGGTYALAHQLIPGVALTEAQMAQLTSDIVWLVEKEVALPDGSKQKVLVPQIYLRMQAGDLDGSGALLSGQSINLNLSGDLINNGTIAGRDIVSLSADNIRNLGGRIAANNTALSARSDLSNIGGRIEGGDSLVVQAGRDLSVVSTTSSASSTAGANSTSRTTVDRVAGLYVTSPSGVLVASAGNDINLVGAQIANDGSDGQIVIVAGRDLKLGTVTTATEDHIVWDAANWQSRTSSQEIGTSILSSRGVALSAGRDLTARAAEVTSTLGAITALSGRDLTIEAGQATSTLDEAHQSTSHGFLSSKTITTRDTVNESTAVSSSFSGDSVAMQAGHDLTVRGSNVVGTHDVALAASNNVNIEAAQQTHDETHYSQTKKSGVFSSGGVGFTVGSQKLTTTNDSQGVSHLASTVGSTDGNVSIMAGEAYRQTGSDVLALQGNIDIAAKKVDILSATDTLAVQQTTEFKQSGFTLAVTSPVISAVQTGMQMKQAASQTGDSRMKVLAAGTTALSAKNAYDAVGSNPAQAGGINVSLSYGTSQNRSESSQNSTSAVASKVAAGRDVHITAAGADKDSNLNVIGSVINADNNASLAATGNINLQAATNTSTQTSNNSSKSSSVGVSYGSDGLMLNLSASGARGKADGTDVTHTNTKVNAGNTLTLQSGADTDLTGATASGKRVVADVGGNLNIQSQQDTSTYTEKQESLGGSLSVGYGKMSGSITAGSSKIKSEYASVTEQAGINAGDEGFQINVKGNTDLKGAVIASTDQAIQKNKNSLTSGTITTSDIQNKAEYSAESISVSAGVSRQAGNGGGKSTPSSGVGQASQEGEASSVTQSGISGGSILITDNKAQQSLTGKDGATTVAMLNRDVLVNEKGEVVDSQGKSTTRKIDAIFDQQKVEKEISAGVAVTQAFSQVAPKAVADFAKSRSDDLKAQAQKALDAKDSTKAQQLFEEARNWDEGGIYRVALHTAMGGLMSGDVSGALGAGAAASAAPLLNDLQDKVKQQLQKAGLNKEATDIISQGISQLTAFGIDQTVKSTTALVVDTNNRQLHDTEKQRIKDLANGDPQKEVKLTAAACALVRCYAEYQEGSQTYKDLKALADMGASDALADERRQLGQQQGLFTYSTNGLRNEKKLAGPDAINSWDRFKAAIEDNTQLLVSKIVDKLFESSPHPIVSGIRNANSLVPGLLEAHEKADQAVKQKDLIFNLKYYDIGLESKDGNIQPAGASWGMSVDRMNRELSRQEEHIKMLNRVDVQMEKQVGTSGGCSGDSRQFKCQGK